MKTSYSKRSKPRRGIASELKPLGTQVSPSHETQAGQEQGPDGSTVALRSQQQAQSTEGDMAAVAGSNDYIHQGTVTQSVGFEKSVFTKTLKGSSNICNSYG